MTRLKQERVWIALIVVAALLAVMVTAGMAQTGDAESTPDAQAATGSTYTVKIGDTLDGIAQAYNVSLVSLMEANNLQPGAVIFPNDTLIIPSDQPPYGFFPGLSIGNTDGTNFYVVQPLDVLDLIAAYFNVDLHCLADYNQITNLNRLQPGTILALPTDCGPYTGTSSVPLAPLRGAMLVGASARVITGAAAPTPIATLAAVQADGPQVVTPTPVVPTATVLLTSTPVPSQTPIGGMLRGATVTPTPSG